MKVTPENIDPSSYEPECRYGYLNIHDERKDIAPVYRLAGRFSDGLAAITKAEKWGYIDVENNPVTEFRFDEANSFKHSQAVVRENGLYGVIDKKGAYLIKPAYFKLEELEVKGELYYISMNASALSGVLDRQGNEVLPHRFTYIVQLADSFENIPFLGYREINATEGSMELFDAKFDRLASRPSTALGNGFQTGEYQRINSYLKEKKDLPSVEKAKEIESLLARFGTTAPRTKYDALTEEEVSRYVERQGYQVFTGEKGKTGLKKEGKLMIPAEYDYVEWVNAVVVLSGESEEADSSYLREHYNALCRDREKGIFIVFCLRAVYGNEAHFYTPDGKSLISLKAGRKVISGFMPAGIIYTQLEKDADGQVTGKSGLISWKGEMLLPPVFKTIDFLEEGHLYVKKETEAENGPGIQYALYRNSGEEIIPPEAFTKMVPLTSVKNLYIAERSLAAAAREKDSTPVPGNKEGFILTVEGNSYRIVRRFVTEDIASLVLDPGTGMVLYSRAV